MKKSAMCQQTRRMSFFRKKIFKNYELYLFILPATACFIVFSYYPMYGVQIAFRDFMPTMGIWGSRWVGLQHFRSFFSSYYLGPLIKNTIGISLYGLIAGFPLPILLALLLNEVKNVRFKKLVQNVTYAPNFISTVVMVGMLFLFLSPDSGIVNRFIRLFGGEPVNFMSSASYIKSIYVWSGVWQGTGWGSIVYLAALTGVDPELHEAAKIDGATRVERMWYINLPCITPTMVIMLILSMGGIMNVGYEKAYLMQNQLNQESLDVISTYVYRIGLLQAQYSFSSAVGLFNSAINLILLVIVNKAAQLLGQGGLF